MKNSDFSTFILKNEFLLISSGGLTDFLSDETIAAIIRKTDGNIEVACEKLVQEAMLAGSESTITVVLAHGAGGR
jgi:serine/threonine protein phosphatase PrpC